MEREHDEYEFKELAEREEFTIELQNEPLQSVERESIDAEFRREEDFINNR